MKHERDSEEALRPSRANGGSPPVWMALTTLVPDRQDLPRCDPWVCFQFLPNFISPVCQNMTYPFIKTRLERITSIKAIVPLISKFSCWGEKCVRLVENHLFYILLVLLVHFVSTPYEFCFLVGKQKSKHKKATQPLPLRQKLVASCLLPICHTADFRWYFVFLCGYIATYLPTTEGLIDR